MSLLEDAQKRLSSSPGLAAMTGLPKCDSFAQLAGNLIGRICHNETVGKTVGRVYRDNLNLVEMTLYDIAETARRNFEPSAEVSTLLFSRGVHAIMAHRIAHQLWMDGDTDLALALRSATGRAFSTDIHPAAQIGAGLWLDHGLGFVVGETSVIAEDVSIWHNVTLGSTLNDSGPRRHPRIETGAVIGAGALLLGGITIGAKANIAAGAIVVEDVPEGTLAVGPKASLRGKARVGFSTDTKVPQ